MFCFLPSISLHLFIFPVLTIRWLDYLPVGEPIRGTWFLPVKLPIPQVSHCLTEFNASFPLKCPSSYVHASISAFSQFWEMSPSMIASRGAHFILTNSMQIWNMLFHLCRDCPSRYPLEQGKLIAFPVTFGKIHRRRPVPSVQQLWTTSQLHNRPHLHLLLRPQSNANLVQLGIPRFRS